MVSFILEKVAVILPRGEVRSKITLIVLQMLLLEKMSSSPWLVKVWLLFVKRESEAPQS